MRLRTFFNKLSSFYQYGVNGTNIYCKYYLQESTFSYELHTNKETMFTPQSLIYESDVFYFWDSNKERKNIIDSIISKTSILVNRYG